MKNFHLHKFKAIPTELDGIKFQSKKEAGYYQKLKMFQKLGELVFFLRQVPFDLPGNVKYRVDFQEFWRDGTVHFVDVKGFRTPEYIMKKKMVEALYPVTIEEA
ncbi:MAG: DUF1064 domain-containing protein [Syntrophales bacterium]|nr:DUF1064 domain-containing protein [Syntrophales bacterium]